MANVSVIIGGGGSIGLAAAKSMPKDKIIILAGRTDQSLIQGLQELRDLGYTAFAKNCDVTKRASVKDLAVFAASYGNIKSVIHCAGVVTADLPERILHINALGTSHVNQEFFALMNEGSSIIDVTSLSAYALPKRGVPRKAYPFVEISEREFIEMIMKKCDKLKEPQQRLNYAYAISKDFVSWYAKKCAFSYGKRGVRVLSVMLGLADTEAGRAQMEKSLYSVKASALERLGTAKEIGYTLAALADERNGYLTGVDILLDGGLYNGAETFKNPNKK